MTDHSSETTAPQSSVWREERTYTVELTEARDFFTDDPVTIGRISYPIGLDSEYVILAARSPGEPWRPTWVGSTPGHCERVLPGEFELGPLLLAALDTQATVKRSLPKGGRVV